MSRCTCGHHPNGSRPAAWCEAAICDRVIWPLSCLPHHRQDALVELLGEHLDAIDVSRAGKTVGRMIVLPANPARLLTAPDSWTVSSVAGMAQPPTMHAASLRSTR